MKKITSLVSTLALIGGLLTINSVYASNLIESDDEEVEKMPKKKIVKAQKKDDGKSDKESEQAYNGEFEIPVIGEIKKQGATVFTWPNMAKEQQNFFRIKTRVNEEERVGDVTVKAFLNKNREWYITIGMTDALRMCLAGTTNSASSFKIGDGSWGSTMDPLKLEVFWKRQEITPEARRTLLKLDFSEVTWEPDVTEDKTAMSYSGLDLTYDPHAIDMSKLNLTTKNKSPKKMGQNDEENSEDGTIKLNNDRKKPIKPRYKEDSEEEEELESPSKKKSSSSKDKEKK